MDDVSLHGSYCAAKVSYPINVQRGQKHPDNVKQNYQQPLTRKFCEISINFHVIVQGIIAPDGNSTRNSWT